MTNPRFALPNAVQGDDWIARRFKELQAQIDSLASARSADRTTVSATGAFKSANFDGDIETGAIGTQGWALTGDGRLFVSEIELRGGIIGNDALASPVSPAKANGVSAGLTFTTTPTIYETQNIPVPAGFTQALVMAISTVGATASSTSFLGLATHCQIGAAAGDSIAMLCSAGEAVSPSAPFATLVTGLSGGSVSVASSCAITGAMQAGSGNARVSAIALFMR